MLFILYRFEAHHHILTAAPASLHARHRTTPASAPRTPYRYYCLFQAVLVMNCFSVYLQSTAKTSKSKHFAFENLSMLMRCCLDKEQKRGPTARYRAAMPVFVASVARPRSSVVVYSPPLSTVVQILPIPGPS